MIKAWRLNHESVAIVTQNEPAVAAALAASGLEDRCLTDHESQFHIPLLALHRYAGILRLSAAAQSTLRRTCPGSDLMITPSDAQVHSMVPTPEVRGASHL